MADSGDHDRRTAHLGKRHLQYFAAFDKLNRLRCLSRATIIGGCTGAEPWEDKFTESFDYDALGNRLNRRYGAYDSADDDAYCCGAG